MADPDKYPEEVWGIEDPRIVFLEEMDKYAVTYTSWSRGGPGVSSIQIPQELKKTDLFQKVARTISRRNTSRLFMTAAMLATSKRYAQGWNKDNLCTLMFSPYATEPVPLKTCQYALVIIALTPSPQ